MAVIFIACNSNSAAGVLALLGGLYLLYGFYSGIEFSSVAQNDGVQLLLDLAQQSRRVDSREIAVDMLVNDFDQGKYFG
jgi:hypothetical protein